MFPVLTGVQLTPLDEFMNCLYLSLLCAEGRHGYPGKAVAIWYRFLERLRAGSVNDLTGKIIAHDSDPNQETLIAFVYHIVGWEYREAGFTRPNDSYNAMGWYEF